MNKVFTISLAAVLVTATVVVILYFIIKKRKSAQLSDKRLFDESHCGLTDSDAAIMKEGMERFLKVMIGLYEPMYQVSIGNLINKTDIFGEWCLRVENKETGTSFSQLFVRISRKCGEWTDEQYINCARIIVKGILAYGVIRDSSMQFAYDRTTHLRYGTLDGRVIEEGGMVSVLKPCWYLDDLILDKGFLM